jgi:phosphoglycerate dehydrogenase-like enzyme
MKKLPEGFRIVSADPLAPKLESLFEGLLPKGTFSCAGSGEENLADVLLTRGREIGAQWIDRSERLKLIHVLGRYPDRVDLESARRRGIAVATMPHGGAMAVADHAMALLLAVARKIVPGHEGVRRGDYQSSGTVPERTSEWSFAFNWLGFRDVVEINRKTLGLVGFGEIGREVARRARGFDMTVLYHQRRGLDRSWEKRLQVERVSLDELLERADAVSLHAPHTEETSRLLNGERLSRMKASAILVNTSRGGLVDEDALVEALEKGGIAGAGLDVFDYEPLPRDHAFTRLPNVVLAPHTGGGSGGGQKLLIEQVLENVERFARGETPWNLVESTSL